MPPTRRTGLPPLTLALLGLTTLVVGGAGAVFGLHAAGIIDLPFLRGPGPARPGTPEGHVAVPVSVRPIAANQKVTRDDLLDPRTATVKVVYLPRAGIRPTMLLKLDDILGRVVKRDKAAGYAFTEDDLHPRGTRPGQAAAVPPGMRAIALHVEKLNGPVHGLKAGDGVDIVATAVIDPAKSPAKTPPVFGPPAPPAKLTRVVPVVEGGIVITPLPPPKKGAKPADTRSRKDNEIVLAVAAEAVPLLESAQATGARLTLLARTGQLEDSGSEKVVPAHAPEVEGPPRPKTTIEVIRGQQRELVRFYEHGGRNIVVREPQGKGKR
jgi:Flp pilus assembly protein CpaB